jgi:hypothetical protein
MPIISGGHNVFWLRERPATVVECQGGLTPLFEVGNITSTVAMCQKQGGRMSVLDILRKLGILRMGATGGTYHNAKERPIELQMDGVFNAEKDLINKKKPTQPPPMPPKK